MTAWILPIFLWHNILFFTRIQAADDVGIGIQCAFKLNGSHHGIGVPPALPGRRMHDDQVVLCKHRSCYAYWETNPETGAVVRVILQGCWDHHDGACSSEQCLGKTSLASANNTRFCCCQGHMCNINMTDAYVPVIPITKPDAVAMYSDPYYQIRTVTVSLLSVLALAFGILTFFLLYRCMLLPCLKRQYINDSLLESGSLIKPPMLDLDQLELCALIQNGKFGEVWLSRLEQQEVVVKAFQPNQKTYYLNEREIYLCHHMELDALPRFYGAEEWVRKDGECQYLIVMEHISGGSLTAYLKENCINWSTLCRMLSSILSGVSHLHSHIALVNGQVKFPIAHRDINSRNILIRPDLSCVICDFGFALQVSGSRVVQNGREEIAEHCAITDVGTVRYMAPEVLEGAVNLRDCESSLKQIDMYAVALVIWEVASQCSDLYQGMPTPTYMLPFEKELGSSSVTFDDMQGLVSKNKTRPQFPNVWKSTNAAVRILKETIENCWDSDSDARLTAFCVEERLRDMELAWDHRFKDHRVNLNPSIIPALIPWDNTEVTSQKANVNEHAVQEPMDSLQPHQGSNPTVERNTHQQSDERITVCGNSLGNSHDEPKKQMMSQLDSLMAAVLDDHTHSEHVGSSTLLRPPPVVIRPKQPNVPLPKDRTTWLRSKLNLNPFRKHRSASLDDYLPTENLRHPQRSVHSQHSGTVAKSNLTATQVELQENGSTAVLRAAANSPISTFNDCPVSSVSDISSLKEDSGSGATLLTDLNY